VHINPDHYLETPDGRVTTEQRNADAWRQCFAELASALERASGGEKLYVLVGAQGSGKSSWARAKVAEEGTAIIFDAILVKRSERQPILNAARTAHMHAVAVWFRTPLEICIARNAARPADEVANERGLRNVFAALEPPSTEEGFAQVLEVHCGA
jgi:chloramphenicol 3-O-phosphotransferase